MRIWDIEFGMYSHEIYNLGGLSLEIIMLILGVNRGYSGRSNQQVTWYDFWVILWRDFMVISSSI